MATLLENQLIASFSKRIFKRGDKQEQGWEL